MNEFHLIDEVAWYKDIGRRIKIARNELGLTQEQLAEKSGTSKHYISRIENEKSGIELMTLKKIVESKLLVKEKTKRARKTSSKIFFRLGLQ